MINKNFYPTPKSVIEKMIDGIKDINDKTILDPSAGKGDIIDYISEKAYYSRNMNNYYVIEIEPELQMILREKKYKLIADDFLRYHNEYIFDIILMNPPFDAGTKHFLHAIEIANNTEIRCLLNTESLENPYTAERKFVNDIIERNNGTVENLGDCFRHAERKTNVNVSLVKIKLQNDKYNFDFKKTGTQEKEFKIEDIENTEVAKVDVFECLEDRYNIIKKSYMEILKIRQKIYFYGQYLVDDIYNIIKDSGDDYNKFIEDLRMHAWHNIFTKTKIAQFVTTKVRQDFQEYQKEQGYMPFTVDNMQKLFENIFLNRENIMQKCIEDAFDLMTKYYKENRVYIEGWKTNDRWKVNRKIILPEMVDSWLISIDKFITLNYRGLETLVDIEKAMCFISGKKYENCLTIGKVENIHDRKLIPGKLYQSEFFDFRLYKKGTIHLTFNSIKLYEKFNQVACKYKNWLPGK